METLIALLQKPWPWYVAGPIIGLTVPLLLWLGNRSFGLSSNLRHLCAIVVPGNKPEFFRYDWRSESWNLVVTAGLVLGGFLAGVVWSNPEPVKISAATTQSLKALSITQGTGLAPAEVSGWASLTDPAILLMLILSGLLVGFGTRWASGCTSGHAITGLSTLQFKSLVATVSFFLGGILSANWILPIFLR
jgi:hypothetical protein